MSIIFTKIK